jgi:hypothetical protein
MAWLNPAPEKECGCFANWLRSASRYAIRGSATAFAAAKAAFIYDSWDFEFITSCEKEFKLVAFIFTRQAFGEIFFILKLLLEAAIAVLC